VVDTGLIPLPS